MGTGLSHALAHQLGSAYGLDHGCGSAICLPPTLRFLAQSGRLDPARVDLLASAFDLKPGAGALEGVMGKLQALRAALGLPRTLREAGVPSVDAARIARAAVDDPTIESSPGRAITTGELIALVESLSGGTGCADSAS